MKRSEKHKCKENVSAVLYFTQEGKEKVEFMRLVTYGVNRRRWKEWKGGGWRRKNDGEVLPS